MDFDKLFSIMFWVVVALISLIMAVLGYFLPWIAPTVALAILGAVALVTPFDKEDAAEGALMFFIAPLIGTLFIKPGLSLGQYEWLVGIWVTAFAAGYLTAYFFQRRGKQPAKPSKIIAAIH